MLERGGGRRRDGRRCRRTAGKARGRVGSTVSVDAAASVGTRGESHGGSRGAGGRSVKCCASRRRSTSTGSATRRDGGIQCAVHAHAGGGTTKAAAIANVFIRRVPLMSEGAVFGINTCSSSKAARFVKLVKGTYVYALLPNEGRCAVAAGIAAACDADTGPIPTVQLERTSVGPAAVDCPTTSSRTAGGGRS